MRFHEGINLDRKPAPTFNYGGKLPQYKNGTMTPMNVQDPNYYIGMEGQRVPAQPFYKNVPSSVSGLSSTPTITDADYTAIPQDDPYMTATFDDLFTPEVAPDDMRDIAALQQRKGLTDTQRGNIGKGLYGAAALAPGLIDIGEGLFAKRDYSQRQINPQYADAIDRMTKAETLYDKYAQAPDISQQLADIRRAELAGLQTTRDVSGGRGSAVASGSLATRLASERRRSALRERAEEIGTQRKLGAQQFRAGLAGQRFNMGEAEAQRELNNTIMRLQAEANREKGLTSSLEDISEYGQGFYRDKQYMDAVEDYAKHTGNAYLLSLLSPKTA